VIADPWDELRSLTPARIAIGRAGGSLPTHELLAFEAAHARAREAVQAGFDAGALAARILQLGFDTILASTLARSREEYLQRPDFGRRVCDADRPRLRERRTGDWDLAVVVSDGLSAMAAERHAVPLLQALLPALAAEGWRVAPVVVVRHARVAIADEVGELLGAALALVLLGERPGLGTPDSLGAYFEWQPRAGLTDASRNCVSNIHGAGLTPPAAATTLHYLLTESRRRKLSGVLLKDERMLPDGSPPAGRIEPAVNRLSTFQGDSRSDGC
jgi:ethanolamine ammonia-lyase small subunit